MKNPVEQSPIIPGPTFFVKNLPDVSTTTRGAQFNPTDVQAGAARCQKKP